MCRWFGFACGLGLLLSGQDHTFAMGFCAHAPRTLREQAAEASLILYGVVLSTRLKDSNKPEDGYVTRVQILSALKTDAIWGKPKVVEVHSSIPVKDPENPPKWLLFCDVSSGNLEACGGFVVSSATLDYVRGLLTLDNDPGPGRLLFLFNHLEHADDVVANDACRELQQADYKALRRLASQVPAARISKWLRDPKTPAYRKGLYASLLGNCGAPEHAELLQSLLLESKRQPGVYSEHMVAYTLLNPKEGWAYIRGVLNDPIKDFLLRYGALRALATLASEHPDVIGKVDLVEGALLLLQDADIADLAIEQLRQWGRREQIVRVLALYGKKSHDLPVVRRAILRFALTFSDQPQATEFLRDLRKKHREEVEAVEEILEIEKADKPITANPGGVAL